MKTELILLPSPDSTHPMLPITKVSSEALDLIDMVLSQVVSQETRRVYNSRLIEFLRRRDSVERGVTGLTREGVGNHLTWMDEQGHGVSARNQALSACKLLAKEAEMRGLITGDAYRAIKLIEYVKQPGVRMGNWLSEEELVKFYLLPDRNTLGGLRDAVILGLLVGCGLRRTEAATITWDRYQERENRMVLVDLIGKGNRIRSVVVPEWVERDMNNWHEEMSKYGMGGPDQQILAGMPIKWGGDRAVEEKSKFREKISSERIWQIVKKYATKLELKRRLEEQTRTGVECSKHFVPKLSPHDLRRTLARLMYLAEADIVEIQLTLGHASVQTTQIYLGAMKLKLGRGKAAVDKIKLNFEKGEELNGVL